jgi:hypothetical protein
MLVQATRGCARLEASTAAAAVKVRIRDFMSILSLQEGTKS